MQRKSKDAEEAEPVFAELQSVPIKGWTDEDGDQVTSAVLVAGIQTVKSKKDSPLAKHQKTFENAWWAAGAEDINGEPYLSRSAFKAHLDAEGHTEGTVKNYMKPSYEKGPIAMLQSGQIIRNHSNGWIILDQVWAAALLTNRGQR